MSSAFSLYDCLSTYKALDGGPLISASGGATQLKDLTDVSNSLGPLIAGNGLVYDGALWNAQRVVSAGFNLGATEGPILRDITNNGGTQTMNFRGIRSGTGILVSSDADTLTITNTQAVAANTFVGLMDVETAPGVPMVPVANQALHFNAVSGKWEQVEELKVDATTRQISLETLGAIAILGDGAVGVQSLTDSIALAGAIDANLTAATGDVNVTAIAADVRLTANADIFLDATSGGSIDASAANGMVLKADAGSVAITSLQDEVVINGKTGVSVLSGIGAPIQITAGANAGVSLLAGVNGGIDLTTGLGGEATIFGSAKIELSTGSDGPIEMTTQGEGRITSNTFGVSNLTRGGGWSTEDTVTGSACAINEIGSGIFNTNIIDFSTINDGVVVSFSGTPSNNNQTLRINSAFGATSSPALYAAKVAMGDGNVVPNRKYVDDAVASAIVSASDVVSRQIKYEAGSMGAIGVGVPEGKLSFFPLGANADVSSVVLSISGADFADPGYVPFNILGQLVGGELFTFRWNGSGGEVVELCFKMTVGVFHALPSPSYEFAVEFISGGNDSNQPSIDDIVYWSYTPSQPPDSLKATIGGDVVSNATAYKIGTVSGNAESTRFIHNDVASINQTDTNILVGESTMILDVNGLSGNISTVNALTIESETAGINVSAKDGLNLTSDLGPIVIQSVNESIDIACPNYMTFGIIDAALNMNDLETVVVRNGFQRLTFTDTATVIDSNGGNIELVPEAVSGTVVVSGDANDYAAKISTVPEALTNVQYVDNLVGGVSSYMSGGISDFQSDIALTSNTNAVYHNATTYSAIKNVTQVQFWVNIPNGNMRLSIYRGWDTTATFITQTNLIVAPTTGLNTATWITPFDLGALENIVIGFAVTNNTLKIMGVSGLNAIAQSWTSGPASTGFPANPGNKTGANNTRAVIRLL